MIALHGIAEDCMVIKQCYMFCVFDSTWNIWLFLSSSVVHLNLISALGTGTSWMIYRHSPWPFHVGKPAAHMQNTLITPGGHKSVLLKASPVECAYMMYPTYIHSFSFGKVSGNCFWLCFTCKISNVWFCISLCAVCHDNPYPQPPSMSRHNDLLSLTRVRRQPLSTHLCTN